MKRRLFMETTAVEAERTAAEIQEVLREYGAAAIMTEFDNGQRMSQIEKLLRVLDSIPDDTRADAFVQVADSSLRAGDWRQLAAELRAVRHWATVGPKLLAWVKKQHEPLAVIRPHTDCLVCQLIAEAEKEDDNA